MSTEIIERIFTVAGSASLKVANIAGQVTIRPGQDGVIQVTATKHIGKGDPEKTKVEIEQAEDGSVQVKTHYESIGWARHIRPCIVDYDIQVPVQCSVKASNVSSNLSAHGLEGTFYLKSVSGIMELQQLSGEMELSSVSGKIKASELRGDLKFESVSGKVDIQASNIPTVYGKSVSGDFKLESPLGTGPYEFKSVSGRVTLIVPGDTRATLSQHGISGAVKTNLPVTSRTRGQGRELVEVQNGGTTIALNSVSGVVRLLSPDAPEDTLESEPVSESQTAQSTPEKPAALSQMEILEAIERGELSVADALQKMNA
ncbi:MAG: DUF4097 family beta strand repeat protein [Anaerolineales bacterium]|nr:DUF4097 family beta strand repeat protein [Anaerolineales bacterium]